MSAATRRDLLQGAASVAATGMIAAAPIALVMADDGDPHLAWGAERRAHVAYLRDYERGLADELAGGPVMDEYMKLEELIRDTPARTVAGVREQLLILLEVIENHQPDERDAASIRSMLATLEGQA